MSGRCTIYGVEWTFSYYSHNYQLFGHLSSSFALNINKNLQRKIVNIFLSICFNICFGCSKELSHWDGSFEYPQHVLVVCFLFDALHPSQQIFSHVLIISCLPVLNQCKAADKMFWLRNKKIYFELLSRGLLNFHQEQLGQQIWFWHLLCMHKVTLKGALTRENLSSGFANNKGTAQPAHPRSLIRAFVIPLLESIVSRFVNKQNFNFLASLCSWGDWY